MSELQPGMLALVIGAQYCQENIGKMVEIAEVQGDEVKVKGEGLIGYLEFFDTKVNSEYFWSLAKHLLPIKPEADPLEIKVNQELHA